MTRARVVLFYQRVGLPWVFDSALKAGIDLVLVPRPDEPVDPVALPAAVVEVLAADLADPARAAATLRAAYDRAPFDGIMTLYDPAVSFVAEVARGLGLPALSAAAALAVRDKREMRRRLAETGESVPGFAALTGPREWAAAAGLRFPVVVKPAGGYSSLGVTRVDRPEDLAAVTAQVAELAGDPAGGLVVEEYLDGPELAVESLVSGGAVRVLTVGYKGNPVGPHFEESVYIAPARLPAATVEAVVRAVVGAHAALGVTDGPTHTELRLRGGSEPYVLELGARVGGSGVSQYIVEGVTGIDLAADALRIAAGRPPEAPLRPAETLAVAANYIVPCGGAGRITAIAGLAEAGRDPRVDHLVQMLFPGDLVRPYPDFSGYPAFVLSRHPSYEDAERMHAELERSIRISYAPEAPG